MTFNFPGTLLDGDSRGTKVAGNDELIAIRLFGTPRCEAVREAFFPSKGFALTAALILAPNQSLSRQHLASLLWEDVEQKRALGNLRQLILRLQKLFGDDEAILLTEGNDLKAGKLAQRTDLALFLADARAEDPMRRLKALLEFGGDLLEGLDAGQDHLYLWLLSERRRLKDLFFSSYTQLLEELTRFGRASSNDIARLSERARNIEPEREETYRAAMASYARIGNISGCESMYQLLLEQLRQEGRPPEAETVALRRRIQSLTATIATPAEPEESSRRQSLAKPRVAFCRPARVDGLSVSPVMQAFVEDVANSLVRYRTFTVLSPHSTFALSHDRADDGYAMLRADYRITSTVFDDARMSVALIEETTGEIVWSLEAVLTERHIHAAFRLLSKQVAAALAREIERLQVEPDRNHSGEAYRQLLEGQQLLRGKCDLPLLRRARSMFRKAVDLDHGMAVARARVAQSLQLEWLMLGGNDPHLLHRAKAEADASVEIDPALGVGHWMCGVVALYQRDFDMSAEKFFEAEALAPNSADLLLQHADALAHFGEAEVAWEKFQQAIDLNPLAPDIYWWAGASIAFKREDYGAAVELCGRMEDDEPALRVLTASHALHGDLAAAREAGSRLQENYPGMTAKEISSLSPDRDPVANEKFYQALRLAGIK
ncbi:BTAD domain-containing putative transcriptional regulator [Agrobacterium pusense]|uniref:BTAD domain-containing putative transcriptional regulator n=1 Tax=Agrobacterium pusense TaxID=648995 RepID=UPI0024474AF1|nr:BTAD domain-containing putative transcriptional regulator [Agrobacterium pusense]MDH0872097.1 SARP family transcriptional regulator [Agrobacterium pusense]MDH1270553.1 SARP family transcriptional regulator [Agrobacterium pusense]